jgi:hypothetical protein
MAKQLASTLAVDSPTRKCFELSPTFLLSRLFSLRQRTVSRSRSSQNNFHLCVDPDPDLHKNLYVFLLPRNRNPSLGHQNPETERETHLVDIPTCISHFSPNITPQTTISFPIYPRHPSLSTTLPTMDQIISFIPSSKRKRKRKREPESEGENEPSMVLVPQHLNEDGNVFTALIDQIQMVRCIYAYVFVCYGLV